MIHYVTPQRSVDSAGVPATPAGTEPEPPTPRSSLGDAPPGPISWELTVRTEAEPAAPAEAAASPHPPSWDAVPHPVGPIAEPQPAGTAAEEPPALPPAPRSERRSRTLAPMPAAGSERPAAEAPRLLATGVHSLGPVGRPHSPALAFCLAVLSLGLHPIGWVRRANREMAQFDPRMVVRPARTAAAISVAALVPLAVALAAAARIVADHLGAALNLPASAQVTRWLLLAPAITPVLAVLLPFSVVALVMTVERVRVVEDRAGVDPELQLSPAGLLTWAAVPVIGLAVYVARSQARLNRVWEACSSPPRR